MATSAASNGWLNFFPLEAISLHHVAGLKGLEAFEPDSAFLPRSHLPDVLFEMLQGVDPALPDQLSVGGGDGPGLASRPCGRRCGWAVELDLPAPTYLALDHAAAGDDAQSRNLDRSPDLDRTFSNLPVRRLAQALGRSLHVLGQLVDDVVVADLDLRPLSGGHRGRGRLEVEADDDRVRHAGKQQV